ncbi:2-C-methyl-D-erythritol 4-phosphate cytidylyltransferase [hydrothermal vent metagenome]|uniref:2-C-methyl-D-erythritol 4-phosphate cytidylyltransferase n=1 Tax=hydrothermal vent metagenome TaxID=652676 RepID=A0A3B0TEH3_9ZZZZ
MKVQAIVPTAGQGKRFQSTLPKSLIELSGQPIFQRSLNLLQKSSLIEKIILVVPKEHKQTFENIVRTLPFCKDIVIVEGGETRSISVNNGIKALDQDTDIVLIHDGVRPLVNLKLVDEAIKLSFEHPAVVLGVRVKPTIKKVDKQGFVKETLDRSELWEIQTPQIFQKNILQEAYKKLGTETFTDEAALVEQIGVKVRVLEGDYQNLKITTKEDLFMAEALLSFSEKKL